MSKLIRIDTIRNDGRFLPNFTEDIKLKKNASIALKDIVFEPEFQVVNVNDTNNQIITKPVDGDGASNILTQRVEPNIYNFRDQYRLAQEVTNTLNRTLGIGKTAPQFSQFSSYRVRNEGENGDSDSRLEIQLRISPVLNVDHTNSFGLQLWSENEGYGDEWLEVEVVGDRSLYSQDVANVNDDRYRLIPLKGVGLSKGSAMFAGQIFDSVALGGGLEENNGFKIGVTLEKKNDKISDTNTTNPRMDVQAQDGSIPNTARNFEIDFRETGHVYRFRSGGLASSPALQNSTLNPFRIASGTASTNDIVMIKVNTFNDRKVIEGVVLQYTGNGNSEGEEHLLFRYDLTNADIGNEFGAEHDPDDLDTIYFTPYIVFKGKKSNLRLTNCLYTPDLNANIDAITSTLPRDSPYFPLQNFNTLQDRTIVDNQFQNVIPQVVNEFNYNPTEMIDVDVATSSITLSDELGNSLGLGRRNRDENDSIYTFTNQQILRQDEDPNNPLIDPRIFGIVGAKFTFQNALPSQGDDYFILELNNLNLDSYSSIPNENLVRQAIDKRANQGERKNIVATIPVKDQQFGRIISYEPNEIHFIGIKNSETSNLRNLQVRILHPDYTQVQTFGRSHVCFYIKS